MGDKFGQTCWEKANISFYKRLEAIHIHPELYYMKPFRIVGNLYFVGNLDVGSYLIDTGDGLILIDTTYPETTALLVNSIWELGYNIKDIKYILHTHGHFDHFGATAFMKELSGAQTFLGLEDAKMFIENPRLSLIEDNKYCYTKVFTPDKCICDGDIIRLGNTQIECIATPGHSAGVISFFIAIEDQGKNYVAGLFGGLGLLTLQKSFFERFELGLNAMEEMRNKYQSSIKNVIDRQVDINLGNHTSQNFTVDKRERMLMETGGANPFINNTEWREMLEGAQHKFDEMVKLFL